MEDLIAEFLEACTHQILFNRDLYPKCVFAQRLIYNVPVKASQHPVLNSFIADNLKGIKGALFQNEDGMYFCEFLK